MLILADESIGGYPPNRVDAGRKNLLSDGDIPHRKKGEDIINCPEEKGGKDDALLMPASSASEENHGRKLRLHQEWKEFRCSYHTACA